MKCCSTLHNAPCCGFVASYGGGDSMQLASPIMLRSVSEKHVHDSLKKRVWASLLREHGRIMRQDPNERVAHVPPQLMCQSVDDLEWECAVNVSTQLLGVSHYNMFFQAWMFADDVQEPGRQGVSRWPLVGMFDVHGLHPVAAHEPAGIGLEALRAADQHVHMVQEVIELGGFPVHLADWHFGSDMARFDVTSVESLVACAWMVAVDLEMNKAHATYLVLVNPDVSMMVEAAHESGPEALAAAMEPFVPERECRTIARLVADWKEPTDSDQSPESQPMEAQSSASASRGNPLPHNGDG